MVLLICNRKSVPPIITAGNNFIQYTNTISVHTIKSHPENRDAGLGEELDVSDIAHASLCLTVRHFYWMMYSNYISITECGHLKRFKGVKEELAKFKSMTPIFFIMSFLLLETVTVGGNFKHPQTMYHTVCRVSNRLNDFIILTGDSINKSIRCITDDFFEDTSMDKIMSKLGPVYQASGVIPVWNNLDWSKRARHDRSLAQSLILTSPFLSLYASTTSSVAKVFGITCQQQ